MSRVQYGPQKTVVRDEDVDLDVVLNERRWTKGVPLFVEFPEGIWKNPVKTGVGHRELNPDWPTLHSQRYQWNGSPHEWRIPRETNQGLVVHYMSGVYALSGGRRFYEDGTHDLYVRAIKISQRPPPKRDYASERRSKRLG